MNSTNNCKYVVYCHQNKINGKKYFGFTGQLPRKRWQYGHHYKDQPAFWEDIRKYGWKGFDHFILYKCKTKRDARNLERELIFKYRSYDPFFGYNKTCKLAEVPIESNNDDIILFNNWLTLFFKIVK